MNLQVVLHVDLFPDLPRPPLPVNLRISACFNTSLIVGSSTVGDSVGVGATSGLVC